MPLPTAEERLGALIAGTYRLERIVGRGGMGVIYAARHVRTSRPVAIKIVQPESRLARERFLREARIAGETDHPNVVEVIHLGEEDDGSIHLVLELLQGESLWQLLARRKKLSVAETLTIALPILDALSRLHESGVIHRDVKPGNI